MAETPEPAEFDGMDAFSVNVYIEYLDSETGEARDILPHGGMVYVTDSAAVAEHVCDYIIKVVSALPALDESKIDNGSFEGLLT